MSKVGLLVAAGLGYVVGTRDGRERYEQIQRQVRRIWSDPRVQDKKRRAQHVAQQKSSELGDKASAKADDILSGSAADTSEASEASETPASAPSVGDR